VALDCARSGRLSAFVPLQSTARADVRVFGPYAVLIALTGFPATPAQTPPAVIDIANAPIPIHILVQSPAETQTDLQVICLFRSSPVNALHGSLTEMNEKLQGLLDRVRKPDLFRGELGETLLLAPPMGSLGAKKLLIIGLAIRRLFRRNVCNWVGEILYTEASRLGVAHPFFAPTILDGGVSKFYGRGSRTGDRRIPQSSRDRQASPGCERRARSARHRPHLPRRRQERRQHSRGIEKAIIARRSRKSLLLPPGAKIANGSL
jgi:hypothetical protein